MIAGTGMVIQRSGGAGTWRDGRLGTAARPRAGRSGGRQGTELFLPKIARPA
jgi:hypothetical protein